MEIFTKLSIICLLFAFAACKKKATDPTRQQILTKHSWCFDSVFTNNQFDSARTACTKACYFTFAADGNAVIHYEYDLCEPESAVDSRYVFRDKAQTQIAIRGFQTLILDQYADYYVTRIDDSVFELHPVEVGLRNSYKFIAK